MLKRIAVLLLLAFAVLGAPACTTTTPDGQTIETPNARMAAVELAYGKVLDVVDAERKRGRLAGARGAEAVRLLSAAKAALDTARAAHKAKAGNLVTLLIVAEGAIAAVAAYVQKQETSFLVFALVDFKSDLKKGASPWTR
jgi:hypothetical protein